MNMLFCMVSRNLKIFLKDKANIFFSLLCPLIVLALYVLFLGKIQVDNLNAALAEAGVKLYGGVSGSADAAVQALLDGSLAYNPNVQCNHHGEGHGHGEAGHSCGHHGEGQGHSCGGHGGCGNH